MGAKRIGNRRAFGFVIRRRAGAVGVDIAHLGRVDPPIAQRTGNRAGRALFAGHHDVGGIRGHGEPDHLGQNIGPTGAGVLVFLEHKDRGALALNHAVAVGRERATGVFGHDAQALPRLDPAKAQHGFRAARDHHGAHAAAHQLERLPHRVVRGRTGGGDGKAGPLEVQFHRQMAGSGVVHQLGHDERMDAVFAVLVNGAVVLIQRLHPATRSAKNNARRRGQITGEPDARLRDRLARGQEGKLGEPVIQGDLLAVEMILGGIVLNLPADLDRQPVDVANVELPDATTPFAHGL